MSSGFMTDVPSSRLVPAIKGIFENLPAAKSREGRSGMTPSGPSRTGTKMNGWGKDAIVCCHAARSAAVSTLALRMQLNVSPAVASAHAGTLETNVSQTGSRREASKRGKVLADPDSRI